MNKVSWQTKRYICFEISNFQFSFLFFSCFLTLVEGFGDFRTQIGILRETSALEPESEVFQNFQKNVQKNVVENP